MLDVRFCTQMGCRLAESDLVGANCTASLVKEPRQRWRDSSPACTVILSAAKDLRQKELAQKEILRLRLRMTGLQKPVGARIARPCKCKNLHKQVAVHQPRRGGLKSKTLYRSLPEGAGTHEVCD